MLTSWSASWCYLLANCRYCRTRTMSTIRDCWLAIHWAQSIRLDKQSYLIGCVVGSTRLTSSHRVIVSTCSCLARSALADSSHHPRPTVLFINGTLRCGLCLLLVCYPHLPHYFETWTHQLFVMLSLPPTSPTCTCSMVTQEYQGLMCTCIECSFSCNPTLTRLHSASSAPFSGAWALTVCMCLHERTSSFFDRCI